MKWKRSAKRERKSSEHLILFDDGCSLCWRSVHKVISWDRKKIFRFTPLKDPSSKIYLKGRWKELKDANTMILIENYRFAKPKIWIRGRAVMRVFWLLGGWKKILGLLAYLPFGIDAVYSFIAARRHRS